MKVIGITGGIGSGKSLVLNILKDKYGALLIDTDGIAKQQMEVGGVSYHGVVEHFGYDILQEDGSIDRGKLAKIVFSDREKLQKLNELTHPNVIQVVRRQIKEARKKQSIPFMVIETALIIESGLDSVCDVVWYVHATEENRRTRLKINRNYSDEKIDSIFASQSKEEAFFKRYPLVIYNNGDISELEKQVEQLMVKMLDDRG